MEYADRRSARRYRFRFPLKVSWPGARASLTETLVISSHAVYSFLGETLAVGTPIQFVLTLHPEPSTSSPVRLNCQGRVQRTEAVAKGLIGIAASIDRYEFDRLADAS